MPKVVYYVDNDENSLTHYGRLGIKWGQHIYGRDETGHKILKKLSKYKQKSQKHQNVASSEYAKAQKKSLFSGFRSAKASKHATLASINEQRGRKFAKKANKILGSDSISNLSKEEILTGERYALKLVMPKTKEDRMTRAKTMGLFDIDFVESAENREYSDSQYLKEYSKYLDNPEKYVAQRKRN